MIIQVTKVWWDGDKLVAEQIDPADVYQEPAYNAASDEREMQGWEPVQVSPLEFVTIALEKEHLVGKPLIWAEWPNREKNGGRP